MKKILLIIILASISIYEAVQEQKATNPTNGSSTAKGATNSNNSLQAAYKSKRSDYQIQDGGIVIKTLPDDLKGSRHQKFILKNNTGETVLIAHNIDLAPKIKSLREGDRIDFFGEYEWNPRGGVVHWTHGDPRGRHVSGWLKHNGKTYQ